MTNHLGVYMYKVIICILLICAFLYIGIVITTNLKKRKIFWQEIINFCDILSSNIGFGQKKLNFIIKEFVDDQAVYSKTFFLQNIDANKVLMPKNIELEKAEEKLLVEFFTGIGDKDSNSEVERIKIFRQQFCGIEAGYIERCKRFSPLIVKLCLIFGIMVCIVLI